MDSDLLSTEGVDWSSVLAEWADLLPPTVTVWFVNRFGDLVLVFDDESVHLFDVGAGLLERIADNHNHFCDLMDAADNANYWFAIPLVDQCAAAGMNLTEGRCYCFKLPPMLGGEYALHNVGTVSLPEHYSFLASIWNQTKSLPDGTQIRLEIRNLPGSNESVP